MTRLSVCVMALLLVGASLVSSCGSATSKRVQWLRRELTAFVLRANSCGDGGDAHPAVSVRLEGVPSRSIQAMAAEELHRL